MPISSTAPTGCARATQVRVAKDRYTALRMNERRDRAAKKFTKCSPPKGFGLVEPYCHRPANPVTGQNRSKTLRFRSDPAYPAPTIDEQYSSDSLNCCNPVTIGPFYF